MRRQDHPSRTAFTPGASTAVPTCWKEWVACISLLRRCLPGGATQEGRRAGGSLQKARTPWSPRAGPCERHTLGDRPKSQPSLEARSEEPAPAAKDWREAAYSLGILKTGYLETAPEMGSEYSLKYTEENLTHAQLSWFKRNPGGR